MSKPSVLSTQPGTGGGFAFCQGAAVVGQGGCAGFSDSSEGEQRVPAWGAGQGSPGFGERFIAAHNTFMMASHCAL